MATKTLPRNGRPPKIREEDGAFFTKVRGVELAFKKGVKGFVRIDRNRGVPPDDVAYGKQIIVRSTAVRA